MGQSWAREDSFGALPLRKHVLLSLVDSSLLNSCFKSQFQAQRILQTSCHFRANVDI